MAERATNIRVRIDIKDAMGKISQMKAGMNSLGATGQKSGTQIQQGMNKARSSIDQAGNAAVKNAVNFQTMGQGLLNLSTAGVQTFTSISNLARAENRAEAASLGLQRAEDLLARKQEQLNKIVERGGKGGRDYVLIMNEIETATNDLAVKTDKLKIEQEAVTDVYLLFGANLMNVAVSSLMIYKSMTADVTKATAVNSAVTAKNTTFKKINAVENWNASRSLIGLQVQSGAATGTLVAQTAATRVATSATRIFQAALGPIGWLLIGIGAAYAAYETNLFGLKDSINGFLGIQEEFNEGVGDGTDGIEEQTIALQGQKKAFDDLVPAVQEYIKMQESIARQTNDPREFIRLANMRFGNSGFSSGVGSTQGQQGLVYSGGSGGSTAFDSGNNIQKEQSFDNGSFVPSAYGSKQKRKQKVEQKLQSQKPKMASAYAKNPFGNADQVIAFYSSSYPEQRDILLSWINNTEDQPGMQRAFMDKYWEIFDISNGFTERKIPEAIDPNAEWKKILASGNTEALGSLKNPWTNGWRDQPSILDFDLDDNRAIILDAIGVDIGPIANKVNLTDGIRFATMKKVSESFSGRGGMASYAIAAFGGNATQAYQLKGEVGTLEWRRAWRAELDAQDEFVNAGGRDLLNQGRTIFGGTFRVSGQQLSLGKYGRYMQNQLRTFGTTRIAAQTFGADDISRESLAAAEQSFLSGDTTDVMRAAQFMMAANRIADDRIDRIEGLLSSSIGVDFDANSKVGVYTRYGGSKNRPLYSFRTTAIDFMEQIRLDIGASIGVSLPSAGRLESIGQAFAENGSFSNFNNVDLTGLTKEKLGMTEQAIFDIRFNATRGDRELLNRIRYVEMIEASSSGTSPI